MNHFLRRQRYLIDYTLSSLGRRPGKSLALLLVYTLIVFLLASVMLFTQSLGRVSAPPRNWPKTADLKVDR